MAEVTVNYKGNAIATMDASGTKTLQTQGKYLEDDVEVVYAQPSGTTPTGTISITENGTYDVTNYASAEVDVESGDLGDFTLLDTISVESGVSSLSISFPSGYTEYAILLSYTLSASARVSIYHSSVSSSRLMGTTNTSASQANLLYRFVNIPPVTIDGVTALTRTLYTNSINQSMTPVVYDMPSNVLFNPASGTFIDGTFKIYGR